MPFPAKARHKQIHMQQHTNVSWPNSPFASPTTHLLLLLLLAILLKQAEITKYWLRNDELIDLISINEFINPFMRLLKVSSASGPHCMVRTCMSSCLEEYILKKIIKIKIIKNQKSSSPSPPPLPPPWKEPLEKRQHFGAVAFQLRRINSHVRRALPHDRSVAHVVLFEEILQM